MSNSANSSSDAALKYFKLNRTKFPDTFSIFVPGQNLHQDTDKDFQSFS